MAAHTDANLVATTFVRNGWGEPILERSPDIGWIEYRRNALGLVTRKADARAIAVNYAYDAAGRLTAISYPANPAENVVFGYDSALAGNAGIGRLTSVTDASGEASFAYDVYGELVSATHTIGGRAYTIGYEYNAAGRVSGVADPSGRVVSYTYDASGRPSAITTRKNAAELDAALATGLVTRPFNGPVVGVNHANLMRELRSFDNDGRIAGYAITRGIYDRLNKSLEYSDAINLTGIIDGLDPAKSQSFSYTPNNRLQNTTGPLGDIDFLADGVETGPPSSAAMAASPRRKSTRWLSARTAGRASQRTARRRASSPMTGPATSSRIRRTALSRLTPTTRPGGSLLSMPAGRDAGPTSTTRRASSPRA